MERVDYQPLMIQDLINLKRRDELDLEPWYQRRSCWTRPQKAYLLNTLFEGKPVPSLYIRHSLDLAKEKSIKEVVDGQQRIRSILEFVDGKFSARHPDHKQRVKYEKLSSKEREKFKLLSLSVGYLVGADETDVVEIFGRLNSVAKTLNLQEKRNAKFSGEFKQFCLKQGSIRVQFWRDYRIFTANEISRMNEVQFVSELVINMLDGLSDYSAKAIDDSYDEYDDEFAEQYDLAARIEKIFALLTAIKVGAIRDTIFHRSPLFFSLFLILDSISAKISSKKLQNALYEVDANFNSDVPGPERSPREAEFFLACTSNMHRIKSRKIRDKYLRKYIVS